MIKTVNDLIKQIYPEKYEKILQAIPQTNMQTTDQIHDLNQKQEKPRNWHKKINLYVTYPNAFEINGEKNLNTLNTQLNHVKNLGCNALHVLPMFESPMIDAGFDISDYKKVRENLGGNEAFDNLLNNARKLNIQVFTDLIFNHISDQHEWFQKAIKGDQKFRNYFIHFKNKPKFIKKYINEKGIWADYDFDRKTVTIRIVFPDFAGEIPHFIHAEDGYWYYHTFYPHQLDLDWNNPDVFLEFVNIIKYWSLKSLNFRLDAITFLGKNLQQGIIESSPLVHKIVTALNLVQKAYNPTGVFLVETCQEIETIKKYYGDQMIESELAYNFPLMDALWTSILNTDSSSLWKVIQESLRNLPNHAEWVTFLRNHDELNFEFVSEKEREDDFNKIIKNGLSFRKDFGVAGRTFSLLDNSIEKTVMAYALLASVPGNPAIIYGDEFGKENDFEFMKQMTASKKANEGTHKIVDDTRDINRGVITEKLTSTPKAQKILSEISKIFNARLKYADYFLFQPKKMQTMDDPDVFAATYKDKQGPNLKVIINISKNPKTFSVEKNEKVVLEINKVTRNKQEINLGAYSGVWLKGN